MSTGDSAVDAAVTQGGERSRR